MFTSLISVCRLAGLVTFAAPAVASTIPFFQVTDLGAGRPSNGILYRPQGINEEGAVVGTYGAFQSAFLWTQTDGFRDLRIVAGLPQSFSSAGAINDLGRIAGSIGGSFGEGGQPVLWDAGRGIVVLDLPGTPGRGTALDISNSDQAVGWFEESDAPDTRRAFIWDPISGMRDLNVLAGVSNFRTANGINEAGWVAGELVVDGNSHAALWDPSAGLLDLTALEGIFGVAWDINDAGDVVGVTDFGDAGDVVVHAFIYHAGELTDLGSLGRRRSEAFAVNNSGQVVGTASTGTGIPQGWFFDGDRMWNLNRLIDPALGWIIMSANDINDAGQIVATARHRNDPRLREFAVLLDPIPGPALPEPGTFMLFAAGLVGMKCAARRRQLA